MTKEQASKYINICCAKGAVIRAVRNGMFPKRYEDIVIEALDEKLEKVSAEIWPVPIIINADDITPDDEWMHEDIWDEIYKEK